MNYEQARFNMIEQQIRPWEVLDNQVLSLLAVVKREDFVPPAHKALAFVDMEIPLPPQAVPSQCMLAPKVEARILQELAVQKHEKVLEIGAGSGYMAALLAHRAQQVITLEIDPDAGADRARQPAARRPLQRRSAHRRRRGQAGASGRRQRPAARPLRRDRAERLGRRSAGRAAVQLLKVGGRLSAIVGFEPVMRATLVTRVAEDAWRTTQAWDTVAPRLLNFPEPSAFSF
jgi:protein-L-isoaspartate(D-aspartate) O-methyltransferase